MLSMRHCKHSNTFISILIFTRFTLKIVPTNKSDKIERKDRQIIFVRVIEHKNSCLISFICTTLRALWCLLTWIFIDHDGDIGFYFIISDKVDDDYLYSWYRSLYNLFHLSRFRLYHTSASDQLCLQITLMESCTYYMSWIRDPGPQTMVLYPPAIDGRQSN